MYICWSTGGIRYFASDSVAYVGDGTVYVSDTVSYVATNVFCVGGISEALRWVKTGVVSGITGSE